MRSTVIIVVVSVLLSAAATQSMPISDEMRSALSDLVANCQYNGTDFSSLSTQDYSPSDPAYKYIVHVCGVATESACASQSGSVCQYTQSQQFVHVLSRWDSTGVWAECTDPSLCPTGGVIVQFANGDFCSASGGKRAVKYVFSCSEQPMPVSITSPVACSYTVVIPTPIVCGINPVPPVGEYCYVYFNGGELAYDLRPLAAPAGLEALAPNYNYKFNPCGVVQDGGGCASTSGTVCQYTRSGAYAHSVAKQPGPVNAATFKLLDPNDPTKGVSAWLDNGDACGANNGAPRQVTINYNCNQFGNSTFYTIVEQPACVFTIEMETPHACPVNN